MEADSSAMNVYTEGIPELPFGTENKNKWTKAVRIISDKLSKQRRWGKVEKRKKIYFFSHPVEILKKAKNLSLKIGCALTCLSHRQCHKLTTCNPFYTL
jgi:hypothetical protein